MIRDLYREFKTIYGFDHMCSLCGRVKEINCVPAICDELAADWQLTPDERRGFDYREGCVCRNCRGTVRGMNFGLTLLETINLKFSTSHQSLRDVNWPWLAELRLAEINNCGSVHDHLRTLPGLSYSEYGSVDPVIPSEDLMDLSYSDGRFDIVLTSDVLEHVPDYRRALSEIGRVLKNDGVFIFTVPWRNERKTIVRAKIDASGAVELLKNASYHGEYGLKMADYMVFYEFGNDFVEELQDVFEVEIFCHAGFGGPLSSVFSCRKRDR